MDGNLCYIVYLDKDFLQKSYSLYCGNSFCLNCIASSDRPSAINSTAATIA